MFNLKSILFQVDNMSTYSYLTKMGGWGWGEGYTKQGDDSHFQRDLGICIVQRDYDYSRVPAWADWASRNFQDSSEWLLLSRVFQEICVKWGFPELYLFALRACHQIQSYLSVKEDPHSLATDAFQQSWKH